MEKVLSELIDGIKNRITSPLLSTFMISWILVNRKFVYTMLFIDESFIFQKYGLLKNEYLSHLFYNHELILSYLSFIESDILINILSIIIRFILPSLMVLVIYKIIYPLDEHIYDWDQEHLWKKKIIQEKNERVYSENAIKNQEAKKQLEKIKEESTIRQYYKELLEDYEQSFKEYNFKDILIQTRSLWQSSKPNTIRIPDKILSFFEEKKLINITNDNPKTITPTEKGRKIFNNLGDFSE